MDQEGFLCKRPSVMGTEGTLGARGTAARILLPPPHEAAISPSDLESSSNLDLA